MTKETEIETTQAVVENGKPTSRKIGSLMMIWGFAKRYPWRICIAGVALIVASAAQISISWGFKYAIDAINTPHGNINLWFELLLLVAFIMGLGAGCRFYFVSWLGERVVGDIRIAVQSNMLRLSPSYFEENRPAEITSRITTDTTVIEQIVGTTVSIALRNLITGIGGAISLTILAPKLAGLLLIAIPLIVFPIVLIGRRLRTLSRASQDRVANVGTIIDEVLGAMKIVQAFGQELREGQRFRDAVESTFSTARRRILIRAFMTVIVITTLFSSIVAVLWKGAVDVQAGMMTPGTLAAFVITGGFVASSFGALTEVYGDLVRGAGAASRLGELLQEQPRIAAPAHPQALPSPAQGRVTFDHVTFNYPTRPDTSALRDFSLDIKQGETVAVVGPSGAGKSTLFQLIQRFYDPSSGAVQVDGVTLPAADPAAVRARIAMVPQETVIFAASARDNLRYGRWDADDDALWAAAEAANAAEFLRKLPEGLDTYMGEGGARLSGGQRQRMAIARAILRDAPILLLDEATSALDAESERLVQGALERLMAHRTTIVIAHRLATVRAANRIIVMDEGQIVEQGTHDVLVTKDGLYARLARLQFDGA